VSSPASTQADVSAGVLVRALAPLGFATTLVGLAGAFVAPLLPYFLSQNLHSTPGQTALFLFLTQLAAVGVTAAVARVSDRPGGRRLVLIISGIAGFGGYGLYAVLREYWPLLVVSLTLVAISGAMLPQIFAFGREIVQRVDPPRATMGINFLRMMLSLSWAAGAPLGTVVVGWINFDGLFVATSAVYALVLGMVFLLGRRGSGEASSEAPAEDEAAVAASEVTAKPPTTVVVGSTVAFVVLQASTTLTVGAMTLFVTMNLHGTVADAGRVLGLCATIEIPLMIVFGMMANRWPMRQLLPIGACFGIAYCLVGSMATTVWEVAAAQLLQACFVCAIGGLGISYFQQLMPDALGKATTLFTNSGRLAGMLSGLIFGVVQQLGYRYAFAFSLIFVTTGTVILVATLHGPSSKAMSTDALPAKALAAH